ncbi:hypothetical protein LPN04_09110 [Rugamonas sp. A1-17]|nr:hypothetical protein [Rugamonas sp. A1-17]
MPLSLPPRDDNGLVVPHDHPEILPEDGILRRISEQQLVHDAKTGGKRISSMVLKASTGTNGGLSVDLQRQIEEAGLDAREYITTPKWFGAIRFRADSLRDLGFQVGFDPLDTNPYHGEVWGNFRANQDALRRACTWFVTIPNCSLGVDN